MIGAFGFWQPEYAARGLATFPVRLVLRNGKLDKVPAVAGYMKLGIRGSTALARKFEHADALGLSCGRRNRLVVVDVDTPDPNVVADAMAVYGASPLVARTPSGGHHIYYRQDGGEDRRRIRAAIWRQRNAPIDVLGNGFVVVPPSRGPKGQYRFIEGTLDDVQSLPAIQRPDAAEPATSASEPVPEGQRNDQLFRHCMKCAARAKSLNELLEAAHRFNAQCAPPLGEARVISTAQSAWNYTSKGLNRFGQHGAWFPAEEIVGMLAADQDAFILLAFLRAHNGPWANFMCTNSLSDRLEWDRRRLAAARNRLVALGRVRCVRQAGRGHAALYEWV
jgi:hypothetical protein